MQQAVTVCLETRDPQVPEFQPVPARKDAWQAGVEGLGTGSVLGDIGNEDCCQPGLFPPGRMCGRLAWRIGSGESADTGSRSSGSIPARDG